MQIPVLVEIVQGNGYRASTGHPLALMAEGATAEEALGQLQELLKKRLAAGASVVLVELPSGEHPWLRFAGTLKNHPLLESWKQAMAEYRQSVDNDPDLL